MSFRNTFITDYLYWGIDDKGISAAKKVNNVFEEYTILVHKINKDGMGYCGGIIKTYDLAVSLDELELEGLIIELEKVARTEFRLVVLQESGAMVAYEIKPDKFAT